MESRYPCAGKPQGRGAVSRFDRYIFSQLLGVFGFFSLILVSVYWINRAVGLFDTLIGDGQTALVFVEFSLLALPNVIGLVLPISAFAAAVYVANRLTQDSELVVMQATGFSAFRLARPVLYFGLSVTAMMLVLAHVLVPASQSELVKRSTEVSQNVSARFLRDGQFTHPAPGITLYIRELAQSGELLDMFLADDRDPDLRNTYTARKALFARTETGPKLVMFDGMVQTLAKEGARLSVTRFVDFTYDLGGLVEDDAPQSRGVGEIPTAELLMESPALLAETGVDAQTLREAAHSRFAQPFLATAAALIGFSALLVGAFSRFGLWRQIIVAIVLLIVVQVISTYSSGLALLYPRGWTTLYAAPIVGTIFAAALLWLSQRARHLKRRPPAGLPA